VVDRDGTTSGLKSVVDRSKSGTRIVFVDAAQVDAVARELNATVKAIVQHHAPDQLLTNFRVLFFDWNVLKGQERLEDDSEMQWRTAFVGGVWSGCD
jgi:hypothetical protein